MIKITKILIILCLFSFKNFAQNGQDKDHQKVLTIEEILMKKDKNKARALFNKEKYLVLENLRNGKANRYYIGDEIDFKTIDNFHFNDELEGITDSTFVISTFNESVGRMELHTINLKDVTVVYTSARKPFFTKLSYLPIVLFGVDWLAFGQFPKDRIALFAVLEAAPFVVSIIGNIARTKKISRKYQVKVFQAY